MIALNDLHSNLVLLKATFRIYIIGLSVSFTF